MEKVKVTPHKAAKWLEGNTHNRSVNSRNLKVLSSELVNGNWRVNGETIKFNGDRLLDGQHRLQACVNTGISFHTYIVRDLEDDVFNTIDTGKLRGAADVFTIQGEINCVRLASSLKFVYDFTHGGIRGGGGSLTPLSNCDMQDLLKEYPAIRRSVQQCPGVSGLVSGSIASGLHYLFSQKDQLLADRFMADLSEVVGIEKGGPMHLLWKKLNKNSRSQNIRFSRRYIAALMVKTWNSIRCGKHPKTLSFNEASGREKFPKIK